VYLLHRSIDRAFELMHGMKRGHEGAVPAGHLAGPGTEMSAASVQSARLEEFTFALMMRWDTVFLTPFDTSILNPDLFYVANWCRATSGNWPVVASDDGRYCRGLSRFYLDDIGFPDFYFAGRPRYTCMPADMSLSDPSLCDTNHEVLTPSPSHVPVPSLPFHFSPYNSVLKTVFSDLFTRGDASPEFIALRDQHGYNHGLLSWGARRKSKIDSTHKALPVKIGRYLYHHMDVDFRRSRYCQVRATCETFDTLSLYCFTLFSVTGQGHSLASALSLCHRVPNTCLPPPLLLFARAPRALCHRPVSVTCLSRTSYYFGPHASSLSA
jgi:hypothetical protein